MLIMLQSLQNLRIHFLSLGFDIDWIKKSFEKSSPDRVYIVEYGGETDSRAIKATKEFIQFTKRKKIEVKSIKTEKDIYSAIKSLKEVIDSEKKNFNYFSITSGQREVVTAFTLASVLFYSIPKSICLYSMQEGEFNVLHSFEAKLPETELFQAMQFIKDKKECSKKQLKVYMFGEGYLKVDNHSEQNEYMKLNRRVIDKLIQWKFIKIDKNTKGGLITLTEDGENWAKIFC